MIQLYDELMQMMMWGGNVVFIEGLYESYFQDFFLVGVEWCSYFDGLCGGVQECVYSEVQQCFYEFGQYWGFVIVQVIGGVSGVQQVVGVFVIVYCVYGYISVCNNLFKLCGVFIVFELIFEFYGFFEVDFSEQVQDSFFSGILWDVIVQL